MRAYYAGVAGAIGTFGTYTETRAVDTGHGVASMGGVFGSSIFIRIAQITDGTSNVIAVGEQSDWLYNTSANTTWDGRSSPRYSGWTQGNDLGIASGGIPQSGGLLFQQQFNITTVQFGLNQKKFPAVLLQTSLIPNSGNNDPIQSVHSGGAHVLFADGRVQFLNESMFLDTFKMLATRDDGQVVGDY